MKDLEAEITVDKEKHLVMIQEYESFEELLTNANAQEILDVFNVRFVQLQKQAKKKEIKPRRIPIKEKRMLAFNLFSSQELQNTKGEAKKFEALMEEKLLLIKEKIKTKEII